MEDESLIWEEQGEVIKEPQLSLRWRRWRSCASIHPSWLLSSSVFSRQSCISNLFPHLMKAWSRNNGGFFSAAQRGNVAWRR